MSDARLERWLAAGQRVLALEPADRLAALEALVEERNEIVQSLKAEPPREPVTAELARALESVEADLSRALAELHADLVQRIDALRRARHATSGYRATTLDRPAFISRSA